MDYETPAVPASFDNEAMLGAALALACVSISSCPD